MSFLPSPGLRHSTSNRVVASTRSLSLGYPQVRASKSSACWVMICPTDAKAAQPSSEAASTVLRSWVTRPVWLFSLVAVGHATDFSAGSLAAAYPQAPLGGKQSDRTAGHRRGTRGRQP
jgi:hypothetical protein